MILDFSSEPRPRYDAQIAIVGSGAAGLALAASLADAGLKIIILESGGLAATGDANELSRGICTNARFTGLNCGSRALDRRHDEKMVRRLHTPRSYRFRETAMGAI